MAEAPWLTIIGIGEDGPDGLPPASMTALEEAEIVMGPRRHLGLLPPLRAEVVEWPVPFADGLPLLMRFRGKRVAVLASGDPFWYGAGSVLARHLDADEWWAFPAPSSASLAAARLGWPLERVTCLGLHAAPLSRMRPHLAPGARLITLLRDGEAVPALAEWLTAQGFGASTLWVMEALGGPRERIRQTRADALALADIAHPVCVALEVAGEGASLPAVPGRPDDLFGHDGQITKAPVRALTMAALAPRAGEYLWDIGAGSGAISIEWLLAHPLTSATAIEAVPERAARARANAARLGVDRLEVIEGRAPDALDGLAAPDAVFIGGGLSEALLEDLWARLRAGTRVVANAVTLESEALLARWHGAHGGHLMRFDISEAAPLGSKRGWRAAYPIVQWSVTR
jgi:precorrin-6B C5,15-methyltransferase / cobalt-precorrin-6B C5,C15-methyltransferase